MLYDMGMRSIERIETWMEEQWEIYASASIHRSRMPDYEILDFEGVSQ